MFINKAWLGTSLLALCYSLPRTALVGATNPIIQTVFTADPAPLVYNDRLWLFTTHDENTATNWYDMRDWRLFSTTDMSNWRHHASPMSLNTFSWANRDAWAGQVVPRNGKFYFYVPIGNGTWDSFAIGVGVSNNIEGPYVDAIGRPLLANGGIDPTVYIDNDGQAYMYWGNPRLYWAKLNPDMISLAGPIQEIRLTTEGFGVGRNGQGTAYNEGPWFYKRNNLYYMVHSAICCPQNIQYSTSPGPTGPWTHRGLAMATGQNPADTNHVGITDYKGSSYFFYHTGGLPGGGSYKRSVCVERFSYTSNGSIPTIPMTTNGVARIGTLDPYVRVEAETIAVSRGVDTEVRDGKVIVAFINNGDYIENRGVAFGTGARTFTASVASATAGGSIEVRLDSLTGPIAATCRVGNTGGWGNFVTVSCPVTGATNERSVFFRFIGSGTDFLFNVDYWQFTR